MRISNIQNNANLSIEDQNRVKSSLSMTKILGTRNYVNESNNDVRSQVVSKVNRSGTMLQLMLQLHFLMVQLIQ